MRSARFGLPLCILLLNIPLWGQQTQPMTAQSPVTKDAQAVSIVSQVLGVAGGKAAITAVADYTGTGTITYHAANDVQGTVTVRGSGLGNIRIDAALPTGIRSEAISDGDGQIIMKTEDGGVTPLHGQAPMSPSRLVLPYLLLAPAVNSPGFSLSYKGLVNVDGLSAHDVQVVRILPGLSDPTGLIREYSTIDFFIDPSTLQLLMMQDVVLRHLVRQVRYSDYRLANGVLVPFSISEQRAGQPTWQMQLSQIAFNTGLQDSDFRF
jgi:outer membrane lipoprotein-sorting protein